MPRKNTRKSLPADTMFHGYNRKADRLAMFRDDDDRRYFKSLFARHLGREVSQDDRGREHVNLRGRVELWCLVVMTTHYHVVLHQLKSGGAGELMRAVISAYVRYFNSKYKEDGRMFVGEVRLRPCEDRRDALNVVAYVHENHGDHCYCEFCSHGAFMGHEALAPDWLSVAPALDAFGGVSGYSDWLHARRLQRAVLARAERG